MKKLSLDHIRLIVGQHIDLPELYSKSKKRHIVLPRQILHYFGKECSDQQPEVIALQYGNKDRCTVLHSHKTISNLYDTDRDIRNRIDAIWYDMINFMPTEHELIKFCSNGSNYDIHRQAPQHYVLGDIRQGA